MGDIILISDQVWNEIKNNFNIVFFEKTIFNLIKLNCNFDESSNTYDQSSYNYKQIIFPKSLSTSEKAMINNFIDQATCSVYTCVPMYCTHLRIYFQDSYIEYLKNK